MSQSTCSRSVLRRRRRISTVTALLALLTVNCGAGTKEPDLPPEKAKPLTGAQVDKEKKEEAKKKEEEPEDTYDGPIREWAPRTYSPRPGSTPEPDLALAEEVCGRGDAALHEAAQLIAELHGTSGEAPSLDVARFHMRRVGSPYVMPRLWSATMQNVPPEEVAENIEKWAQTRAALGEHRCGLGLHEGDDGKVTVSALQVDVLAEVKPVPTAVESGTWVELDALLLAPTSSATVLLLPPVGAPRSLSTKTKGNRVSARFSIETEGTWLVQLMATQSGGPRPVAELLVTADHRPPQAPDSREVPGEDAMDEELRPTDALFTLMNSAREEQGLPRLKRNRDLDRAARAHSEDMLEKGRISHNTGKGDPAYRISLLGLSPKATGENVALAASVIRLHRVLWASPAHRENLLLRRWDEAGVGITQREDGTLFATQLFIDDN